MLNVIPAISPAVDSISRSLGDTPASELKTLPRPAAMLSIAEAEPAKMSVKAPCPRTDFRADSTVFRFLARVPKPPIPASEAAEPKAVIIPTVEPNDEPRSITDWEACLIHLSMSPDLFAWSRNLLKRITTSSTTLPKFAKCLAPVLAVRSKESASGPIFRDMFCRPWLERAKNSSRLPASEKR